MPGNGRARIGAKSSIEHATTMNQSFIPTLLMVISVLIMHIDLRQVISESQ